MYNTTRVNEYCQTNRAAACSHGYEHEVIEIHAGYAREEDNLADLLQQIDDDLSIRERGWDG